MVEGQHTQGEAWELEQIRTTLVFQKAKRGDELARNELVRRLLPKIERFVAKECGAHVRRRFAHADLIQEAVIRTLEYLPSVEGDKKTLEVYVYRVAKNVVASAGRLLPLFEKLDQRSPLSADATVLLEPPDHTTTSPSVVAIRHEELALARTALSLLEPRDQEVFIRIRLLGEEIGDVASSLGRDYDAVRVHSYRAYSRLLAISNRLRSGQLEGLADAGDDDAIACVA